MKNERSESRFEVLDHALKLRKEVTNGLLIDFGFKIADIKYPDGFENLPPEERTKWIDKIIKLRSKQLAMDDWFMDICRKSIIDSLMNIISNVQLANAIYITSMEEYKERRAYQNRAIGFCGKLSQEMQYVIETLPVDINKYTHYAIMIRDQINLLKGWRKSDNKFKKKFEQ